MTETPTAIVPAEASLVLRGDPEKQIAFAEKASKVLVKIIKQKPNPVIINKEQYIEFEDWQMIARFYGATVAVEFTKPIEREGKIIGYEARANVVMNGENISSAEAMCTRSEKLWMNRDEYALKSMAQTRSCAKALRNVFAWVVVLAGFQGTTAEEMPGGQGRYRETAEAPPRSAPASAAPPGGADKCMGCLGNITQAERQYSSRNYGKELCRNCQPSR